MKQPESIIRRRTRYLIAGAAAISTTLLAVALLSAMPASADTVAPDISAVSMSVAHPVSVLDTQPDSTGHVRVAFSDGSVVSVPAVDVPKVKNRIDALHRNVQPDNTVPGPCGTSYITLSERSDGYPVHMDTGFKLSGGRRATSYAWSAWIQGAPGTGYSYDYHASGDLDFRDHWDGHHTSGRAYPRAPYAAGVNTGVHSYALLDNGDICTSGGPTDSRNL